VLGQISWSLCRRDVNVSSDQVLTAYKKSPEIWRFRTIVLPLPKQQTLFEKREKLSVSEHFTTYLSVARTHAKVLYLKDSQYFIP